VVLTPGTVPLAHHHGQPLARRIPRGLAAPLPWVSPVSLSTARASAGQDIPVTLEFDLGAKFTAAGDSLYHHRGDPGTDPTRIVMLGGHFDSLAGAQRHYNGAAARIL